jgi:drug/metabolite transporter (DMT)-like permease
VAETRPSELDGPVPAGANDRSRRLAADLALLLVTLVWGSTFVMVKTAVATYPPFSFLAVRFAIAGAALLPFVIAEQRRAGNDLQYRTASLVRRPAAPLLIGLALFAGFAFQTIGLQLTTPAKAGFITGTYVVIVPLLTALILRQMPGRNAWLGVGLALVGMALLSLQAGLVVGSGDALVFACAWAFAIHILLTGWFARRYRPFALTFGQIVVVAALSAVCALVFEPRLPLSPGVLGAGAFTGVLATSVAFGVQVFAQRFTTSTHTALIFSCESVFAALSSYLFTGELLAPRQILGCALILGGILIAETGRKA